MKLKAVLGFAEDHYGNRLVDPALTAEYIAYLTRQRVRLYPIVVEHTALLRFMLEEKIIPKKHLPEIIALAQEAGNTEAAAALLDYSQYCK